MLHRPHTVFFRLFLSIAITSLHITACMENIGYLPLELPSSTNMPLKKPDHISHYPIDLDQDNQTHNANPYGNMKIIGREKKGDRFDVCFTYAITEHLNISGQAPEKLKLSNTTDLITQCNVLEKYYQPIENPCPDCLVVYTNEKRNITHFGIATITSLTNNPTDCMVKSKWGTKSNIFEHELFNVPSHYGSYALFYQLKNEFQQNKLLFLELLQKDIQQSEPIKKSLIINQTLLLHIANGKNISSNYNIEFNKQNTIHDKAWFLLKTCMGLNINTLNRSMRQTVLMLAAKRNDQKMMELFLSMGANINQKDKDGNTALMLAAQNNHQEAMYTLLCYGADTTLKNNSGHSVHVPENITTKLAQWKNILLFICHGIQINSGNKNLDNGSPYEQAHFILTECDHFNINAQQENDKRSPLIIAAHNNDLAMVQLLIKHGADATLRDNYGLTALDYAILKKNKEIAQYLQEKNSSL